MLSTFTGVVLGAIESLFSVEPSMCCGIQFYEHCFGSKITAMMTLGMLAADKAPAGWRDKNSSCGLQFPGW